MPNDHIMPLSRLPRASDKAFELVPDATGRAELARTLDLLGLRKVRFAGRLIPEGKADWRLEAALGATVVQPCVVTTEPVTTRIDEPVTRRYVSEMPSPPSEDEVPMPEDDTLEPLAAEIDLNAVMEEALALALPDYPRVEGADLGQAVFAQPGLAPMTDEDAKPLAGLAALRDRLAGDKPPEDEGGN
jgi:uncharacterized metal-binding protein YceD (DUF177 family)